MKRLCLLAFALLLLLTACGRAAPTAETTVPMTTEIEITTEAETTIEEPTTVFVPLSGESNGVTWRLLDLEDIENARQKELLKSWKEEHHPAEAWKYITELSLSETVTVYETPTASEASIAGDEIRIRDETTGKESVLLKHSEMYPALVAEIDARYFVFVWCYPVYGISDPIIFDTKEKREIPIEYDRAGDILLFVCAVNSKLYFREVKEEEPMPDGKPHVLCADVADLYKGRPLKAVNLLEDFSDDVGELRWPVVSPNGRYLAACTDREMENNKFVLFDLELRRLMLQLPLPPGFGINYIRFADAQTVYCYNHDITHALEITLP